MSHSFNSKTTRSSVAKLFASGIKGKTIVIAGVNIQGLGGKTVEVLSQHSPKTFVFASRTASKVQEVIDYLQSQHLTITYIALPLNLSSQRSCREAEVAVLDNPQINQIDLLINNAGIMRLPSAS
jgi:NADP-dependent 3-hydroxy acid dehydrogenase YdfG